jgi:hypothetical protein
MVTSTVLTLVVVPVVYTLMDDLGLLIGGAFRRSKADDEAPGAIDRVLLASPDGNGEGRPAKETLLARHADETIGIRRPDRPVPERTEGQLH